MPISDSNPERRNLLICSFGFILYFLADGKIQENSIKLQVVNIVFNRTNVIIILAWVLLFWFAARYWQVNKGKLSRAILEEFTHEAQRPMWNNYVVHSLGKSLNDKSFTLISWVDISSSKFVCRYVLIDKQDAIDEISKRKMDTNHTCGY